MAIVRRLMRSQLLKGSFLIFIAGNLGSFGNFLYNLFMGRMLRPEVYGELEAVLSLSSLIVVPLSVLSLYIVKIVSSYWGAKNYTGIFSFLSDQRKKLFLLGLGGFVTIIIISPLVLHLLNSSSYFPVLFLAAVFLSSGLTTVNNGGLQGTLSFGYITANGILTTTVKLIFSAVLVYFNFQLAGALFGPIAAVIIGFLLSTLELRLIVRNISRFETVSGPLPVDKAFLPSLFAALGLTALFTVDVILARHFLPPFEAGEYAAIATVGKIVYYVAGPIITVMFPIISSRVTAGTSYRLPLLGSLVMSLGVGIVVVLIFFMFPGFILGTLFGTKYLGAASFLAPYAFFTLLYMAGSILTYFLLSVSVYRPMALLFGISLLQGIIIFLFHASVSQIILVNILVATLYLLVVSFYAVKTS